MKIVNEIKFLTPSEIDGVHNNKMYIAIQDYLSNRMFNDAIDLNIEYDKLIDDPLYIYIQTIVMDKDHANENAWENILFKCIFKRLHACVPFINLVYENRIADNTVNDFCAIRMIVEAGIHDAICKFYTANPDNEFMNGGYNDLFYNNFTIDDISIALSYSIANDVEWWDYFNKLNK